MSLVNQVTYKTARCEIIGCKNKAEFIVGAEKPFNNINVLRICHECGQQIYEELTKRFHIYVEDFMSPAEMKDLIESKKKESKQRREERLKWQEEQNLPYRDSVGGFHFYKYGWNPQGLRCECEKETCEGCPKMRHAIGEVLLMDEPDDPPTSPPPPPLPPPPPPPAQPPPKPKPAFAKRKR